jgi:cyclic pyranopterin phosphate synthase
MPQTREPEFFPADETLSYEEIERLLRLFASLGVRRVRITGGEPLARRDAGPFLEHMLRWNLFEEISLSTNGHYFAPWAGRLFRAGLRRVNISLDSLDPLRFHRITRSGDLDRVFESIDAALSHGYDPVKINTVMLRGLNHEEIPAMAAWAIERGAHIRFIELMPVGGDGFFGPERVYPVAQAMQSLSQRFRMRPLAPGEGPKGAGPAHYYAVEGYSTTIGFVGALTCNFCARCNRMRLSSDGCLYPCLDHDHLRVDLKSTMRQGAPDSALENLVLEALRLKPEGHSMTESRPSVTHAAMSAIGG